MAFSEIIQLKAIRRILAVKRKAPNLKKTQIWSSSLAKRSTKIPPLNRLIKILKY